MPFKFKNGKKSKKEEHVDKEKTDEDHLIFKNKLDTKNRYHKMFRRLAALGRWRR